MNVTSSLLCFSATPHLWYSYVAKSFFNKKNVYGFINIYISTELYLYFNKDSEYLINIYVAWNVCLHRIITSFLYENQTQVYDNCRPRPCNCSTNNNLFSPAGPIGDGVGHGDRTIRPRTIRPNWSPLG